MTNVSLPITRQAQRCEAWATVLLGCLVATLLLLPLRVLQLQLHPDAQLGRSSWRHRVHGPGHGP